MWSRRDRGPFERLRAEYITTSEKKMNQNGGVGVFDVIGNGRKRKGGAVFGIASGGLKFFKDGILMLVP